MKKKSPHPCIFSAVSQPSFKQNASVTPPSCLASHNAYVLSDKTLLPILQTASSYLVLPPYIFVTAITFCFSWGHFHLLSTALSFCPHLHHLHLHHLHLHYLHLHHLHLLYLQHLTYRCWGPGSITTLWICLPLSPGPLPLWSAWALFSTRHVHLNIFPTMFWDITTRLLRQSVHCSPDYASMWGACWAGSRNQ